MKRICALAWLGLVLTASGCADYSVQQRIEDADRIATDAGLTPLEIPTGAFTLRAYSHPERRSPILRIYIEGDGFAWASRHQPSRNPTPTDPVALRLAAVDESNAAYLARPCQIAFENNCDRAYWTGARFSPDVIAAMNEAVTRLKLAQKADRLILIGYSGGGAIAALIAARRDDVLQLVTVAGNLSHRTWSRHHSVSGLTASLDALDQAKNLSRVPQLHFISDGDEIMPATVAQTYRMALQPDAPVKIRHLGGVCHQCWPRVWTDLLQGDGFADRP